MFGSVKKLLPAVCAAAVLLCGCQVSGREPAAEKAPTLLPGWNRTEEMTCYVLEDGSLATGWLELEGNRYYLRQDGTLVTGWLSLDGQNYYLDEKGAAVRGKVDIYGILYLFDQNGALSSGWTEVDGCRYYGDENGHPVTGWAETDEGYYYFDEVGHPCTGWLEDDGELYYLGENGRAVTGEAVIDGQTHHFTSRGRKILLVNPWSLMPEDYTVELTDIGSGHRVAAHAYGSYREMMDACRAAGHDPVVRSSFRTWGDQEFLYNRRIQRFKDQGYSTEEATELAGTIVAIPGTSEHQLGLALDIVDSRNRNLDESQAETATQQWLMEHSWEYGWILRYPDGTSELTGIIYEPWHYRYVGRELAAELHELDICLEEYLQQLTAD